MISDSVFNFNVHDYTDNALLNAKKRASELKRGNITSVHIDYRQMGLGGDDSWSPRVHPEYLIPAKSYNYSFRLRPIDKSSNLDQIMHVSLPVIPEKSGADFTPENGSEQESDGEVAADVEEEEIVKPTARKSTSKKVAARKKVVKKKVVKKKAPAKKKRRRR